LCWVSVHWGKSHLHSSHLYARFIGVCCRKATTPTRSASNGNDPVTYYHLELPHHALIPAEQLPVECYLDSGDRARFSGGPVTVTVPVAPNRLSRYRRGGITCRRRCTFPHCLPRLHDASGSGPADPHRRRIFRSPPTRPRSVPVARSRGVRGWYADAGEAACKRHVDRRARLLTRLFSSQMSPRGRNHSQTHRYGAETVADWLSGGLSTL
jgi:hypothetical protein